MRRYDESGITRTVEPPSALRELGTRTACVVTSDLQRGVESAEWLVGDRRISIHPELREARCLPQSLGFPARVPPRLAIVLGWMGWWLNLCEVEETISATRLRAARAVDLLTTLAEQHGTVLAVGHGMFNRFIAQHLRKRGWRGPRLLPSAHWSSARYVRDVGSPARPAPAARRT
jgi:broad specificity phosphatase PhoE